jgi:VanZ family protein
MFSFLENKPYLHWTITILIAATIFFLSSLSFPPGLPGSSIKSIIYHISAFFFLTLSLLISLVRGKHKKLIISAFLLSLAYGITDELHQFLVPGRATSISDVYLDTIGIALATLIYSISLLIRTTNKNQESSKPFPLQKEHPVQK